MFHEFGDSIFESCLHLINYNFTSYLVPSSMQSSGAGTSSEIPLQESGLALFPILITLPFSFFEISYSLDKIYSVLFNKINMSSIFSIASSDSHEFYVEQISNEPNPQRNNSPNIFNSTEISQTHTPRMPSVSSIASPEHQILTIHDD